MDMIFKALADPARRTLLDALRQRDGQSLQDLTELLEMTRFGVMKHLGVLEDAELIVTHKQGRFKYHYLNAAPLQQAIDRWIEPLLVKPAARAVLDLKTTLERNEKMTKPDFMMQIYINCTQDALWDALTDPASMAQINPMAHKVERDGGKMTYFKENGDVMLINTETDLTHKNRIEATFEPKWAGPDVDLPHSKFVYLIEEVSPQCRLIVEHYDIPAGQEGVSDGWAHVLSAAKSWLEKPHGGATA